MEGFYRFNPTISCSPNDIVRLENLPVVNFTDATTSTNEFHSQVGNLLQAGHGYTPVTGSDMHDVIKTQIANHPRYPDLVSAYVECRKVGAPPEMVSLLEDIGRCSYQINTCYEIGADPELDEFMESYCEVLHRYKEELSKPFDEATTFLSSIESQLSSLCKGTLTKIFDYGSDEPAWTSEEELSCGEVEASETPGSLGFHSSDQNLKGVLLSKYSGHLSNLRKEFLKQRKKGKLPKDAKTLLLDWWNHHYRWPYPTEEEKAKLSEINSDPARRSRDSLVAFLQTFTDEDGSKFVDNVLRSLSNCETLKETMKESLENESPEQRLVRSTLEHPLYLSKYALPTYEKGWAVTKVRKKPKLLRCNKMLAVDCEMVLCKDGTDALVRVCVVDADLKVKLDELVNPCKPVEDYRTEITGVTAEVLDGASCSFADIQISMKKLLSRGTILVGHSLYNDLQALKVDHARVIDTSFIFKSSDGRSPSLNNLCKSVLGYELRKAGDPHNCLDDACAAMKLVLAKIERGVDNYIPLIQPDVKDASYNVPEIEMAKLLLHKIPVTVPREKLRRLFPANYTIEIKTHKVIQGVGYSVLAIFKNPEEACQAFENLIGSLEKDTSGRPQKLVALQLDTGGSAGIRVRKMTHDSHVSQKKRSFEGEDSRDPKKPKIDQCDDHLKEIERLKQELKKQELNQCDDHLKEIERLKQEIKTKDFEITAQDKIITELKRKLEEMKKKKNKER